MSNRADFFEGECRDLAIPAGRCEAFLDGEVCPFLEVTVIVRAGQPEFGWAKLRFNPAAYEKTENISIEQVERIAAMGKRVEICQFVNVGIGEAKVKPICIFAGQVEGSQMKLGPREQLLEITAKDFAARLDRITIHGRRVATTGGESTFNDGAKAVFNEDNLPNASKGQIQHNCRSYTAFAAEGQEAKYWSTAEVMVYLLSEHVVFGQLQIPSAAYLEVITKGALVDELDVEGKSVLDALGDCCEQAGIEFCFMPRQAELGPAESIVFYRPGLGRKVELNLQYTSEQLSISRTNVCKLRSEKRHQGVVGSEVIETIDVQTPMVVTYYEVGDRVKPSPDSRDILGVRCDNRSIFWIERVAMDFEKQSTNLKVLRRRDLNG